MYIGLPSAWLGVVFAPQGGHRRCNDSVPEAEVVGAGVEDDSQGESLPDPANC